MCICFFVHLKVVRIFEVILTFSSIYIQIIARYTIYNMYSLIAVMMIQLYDFSAVQR